MKNSGSIPDTPSRIVKEETELTTSFDPLKMRKILGKKDWNAPIKRGDGWVFVARTQGRIIVSTAEFPEHNPDPLIVTDRLIDWVHASISRRDRIPTYEDLTLLYKAVFNEGWAYQVFAPPNRHINIDEYCLHLWGRLDGRPSLPDFQRISGINSV